MTDPSLKNSSSSSTKTQAQTETPFIHLISGAAAGLFADGVTHPVDTIRTRIQVQRKNQIVFRNTTDAFIQTFRNEGWRAFYKGFGIVCAFTVPAHGLYFAGYEMAKRTLSPSKPLEEKGPLVHFLAGFWADVCGAFVWVPMDVVKQRLQLQRQNVTKYQGSFHALKTIVQEEGIRGLFKGYAAALATYGPFVGIYFVVYEQCKRMSQKVFHYKTEDEIPLMFNAAGGVVAGAVAAAVTCPMDVIKTRIQVETTYQSGRYLNLVDAMKRMYIEEGLKSFVRGIVPRIFWIAPATGLTIGSYEWFKRMFHRLEQYHCQQ